MKSYNRTAVTGPRALALLQKHLPAPNAIGWDAPLDDLVEKLDCDI